MRSALRFHVKIRRPAAGLLCLAVAALAAGCGASAGAPPGASAGGRPARTVQQDAYGGAAAGGGGVPGGAAVPSWGRPLPYPIVIADRMNNRLIEVTPDKRIVWEFDSPNLQVYRANDDVFFSPDGRQLAVSEESNYDIHLIDYGKRQLAWTWGHPDQKGAGPGYLNYPDDAYLLANGEVVVADIRNCRILFIDPKANSVTDQWGRPGVCRHDPPKTLGSPNGVTPLPGGDFLVTEINGHWLSRVTRAGKVLWSVRVPGLPRGREYPSDAYPTADGQVVVANYSRPGRIVVFDPATGRVSWEYAVDAGEGMLDHPSLAKELPTGDIIVNDDYRHRVVVIDRQTKKILWQYGVTDVPGRGPGYLNVPDGFDLDVWRDFRPAGAPHSQVPQGKSSAASN